MPVSKHTLQEHKFAAMRRIDATAQFHRAESIRLFPLNGTIGIGGADFDHLLKAEVAEAYLRVLRRGGTPEQALSAAQQAGAFCVEAWNKNGHRARMSVSGAHELRRWDKAGESEAEHLHRHFLALARV